MAFKSALLFVLSAKASVLLSRDADVVFPRQPSVDLLLPETRDLSSSETLDIDWAIKDTSLFSANWVGGTGQIPVGATPFETSLGDSFSLDVECRECRTHGNITAEFSDSNGLKADLMFNDVGAYVDLDIVASDAGTYTIGLGRFLGIKNLPADVFSANIGLGLDLVLSLTGAVQATGGFQLTIPSGQKVGLDIDFGILFQGATPSVKAGAGVNLFPHVDFSLLPISLNSTSVNVTAALVLRAEASVNTTLGPVSANAIAGAHLTLVQVTLGWLGTSSGSCANELFVEVETNAGAVAQVGAQAGGGFQIEEGPEVSTVFASVGTSTCLGSSISTTKPPAQTSTLSATCSGGQSRSMTACMVPAVAQCPDAFTQVVLVAGGPPCATATATAMAVNGSALHSSGCSSATVGEAVAAITAESSTSVAAIALSPMATPIQATPAAVLFQGAKRPVNATVPGVFATHAVGA